MLIPFALPNIPQDSSTVGKGMSQAVVKAKDSVKIVAIYPKVRAWSNLHNAFVWSYSTIQCERCARVGQDCLRRSGQLVGDGCTRCAVSKQGCVYPSKESRSEKARKTWGKDEKKGDGNDDLNTLETALRLSRSSKQGLKRKRSDGLPEAMSSSSQALPPIPVRLNLDSVVVDLLHKKGFSSTLITDPSGSGDLSSVYCSPYDPIEPPHSGTVSLAMVSSADHSSLHQVFLVQGSLITGIESG